MYVYYVCMCTALWFTTLASCGLPASTYVMCTLDHIRLLGSIKHQSTCYACFQSLFLHCRVVLCSSSDLMRQMFEVNNEKATTSQKLSQCKEWSQKRLKAVSACVVNEGVVKGFVKFSQRYVSTRPHVC